MDFLRKHGTRIWTAAILVGLAAVMIYALVVISSKVVKWDQFEVVVLSRDVPPNLKNPAFRYRVAAPDGRQIELATHRLFNIGDHLRIEETVRENGYSTYIIISP